jgi:hypothetical protein
VSGFQLCQSQLLDGTCFSKIWSIGIPCSAAVPSHRNASPGHWRKYMLRFLAIARWPCFEFAGVGEVWWSGKLHARTRGNYFTTDDRFADIVFPFSIPRETPNTSLLVQSTAPALEAFVNSTSVSEELVTWTTKFAEDALFARTTTVFVSEETAGFTCNKLFCEHKACF